MKTSLKIVHWTPRVLFILAVLFVSMFALDAFDPKLSIWQQIGGFLIHLVPSFILTGLLIFAWKYELVGGIIITALALGTAPSLFVGNYRGNHSVWISLGVIAMINMPFIITGVLFILSFFLKKKNSNLA
jgi:hypothetical protein